MRELKKGVACSDLCFKAATLDARVQARSSQEALTAVGLASRGSRVRPGSGGGGRGLVITSGVAL